MSYVLEIKEEIDVRYRRFGRPGVRMTSGFISKEDPNDWYVGQKLQRAHRWKTVEKAEAAAVLMATKFPTLIGRMEVTEVTKNGKLWMRAKNAPRSHRDW
jgi:hypothetical protein